MSSQAALLRFLHRFSGQSVATGAIAAGLFSGPGWEQQSRCSSPPGAFVSTVSTVSRVHMTATDDPTGGASGPWQRKPPIVLASLRYRNRLASAAARIESMADIIPFPTRLRVVPQVPPVLIEHDGHPYLWADLFAELTPQERQEIDATAPRTAQAAWDEIVRRWPWLAAELVADLGAVE